MMLSIVHLRARCSALYKPVERLIYQALTIKERQRDMNAKRFISYAALVAGVFILNGRLNAAVESEIVGYQTRELPQGVHLVSIPFEELGTDATDYPIQKIKGTFQAGFLTADQLLVWDSNTSKYKVYLYTEAGWTKDGVLTDDCIKPTECAFIMAGHELSVTCSGKVVSEEVTQIPVAQGIYYLANPYVTDIPVADIKGDLSSNFLMADQLLRWDNQAGRYITYIYTSEGWKKEQEPSVTTDVLPAGEGFILMKATEGGINFTSPLR